jgi:transcriptional regulator GlxA family with amidase domain
LKLVTPVVKRQYRLLFSLLGRRQFEFAPQNDRRGRPGPTLRRTGLGGRVRQIHSIYIRDKNIYTSAGVTAGIDLSLALVEEDLGASVALQIARMMVVFLRRSGGQSQFSSTLAAQTCESRPLRDLLAWMADKLTQDMSVASLARRAAIMSPRNFARVFTHEVGQAPARHVENLRLEAARRQLDTTSSSLEEVAEVSGL